MKNIRYTKGKATPLDKVLKTLKDGQHSPEPEEYHQQQAVYRKANRCPKDHKWYTPGHFIPWAIDGDNDYESLTRAHRKIFKYLCRRSRPTRKKPTRRYISISIAEIARDVDVSTKTVERSITSFLDSNLLRRWHRGFPLSGSSRYEIPASLAQIRLWRIPRKKRWHKNQ